MLYALSIAAFLILIPGVPLAIAYVSQLIADVSSAEVAPATPNRGVSRS